MNARQTPGGQPRDHTEQVDWIAISDSHGRSRRIHKVEGDPNPDELQIGDEVDVACRTTLVDEDSSWQAKPATVFPPGYYPLCSEECCFGHNDRAGTEG